MTANRAAKMAARASAQSAGLAYTDALRTLRAPAPQPFTARVGFLVGAGSPVHVTMPENHPPIFLVAGQTGTGYTEVTKRIGAAFRAQNPGAHTLAVDDWARTAPERPAGEVPDHSALAAALEAALSSPRRRSLVVYNCDITAVPPSRQEVVRELLHSFIRTGRAANARMVLGVNRHDAKTLEAVATGVAASAVLGWGDWADLWTQLRRPEPPEIEVPAIGVGWLNTSTGTQLVDYLRQ